MKLPIKETLRPLYYFFKYYSAKLYYRRRMPKIMSIEETLLTIIHDRVSISRYGDGELSIMCGGSIRFCHQNEELRQKLIEVTNNPISHHIVCLPPMLQSLKGLTPRPKRYWKNILAVEYRLWFKFVYNQRIYGNTFISRFFMDFQDQKSAQHAIDLWKKVWNNRDCIIVEGCNTRMGMGNSLFENAKRIRRILCPPIDAYNRYTEILTAVKDCYNKADNSIVLIALGPVATILAYDLCKVGIQSIDTGHLDIEYEWFLKNSPLKINIPNKAVNEYHNGGLNVTEDITDNYKKQIVLKLD